MKIESNNNENSAEKASDLRRHPRFKIPVSVIIHRPYYENKLVTHNVSIGGACVTSRRGNYGIYEKFSLELVLPHEKSIFCDAAIVKEDCDTIETRFQKLNLRFENMSGADAVRLSAFLQNNSNNSPDNPFIKLFRFINRVIQTLKTK